ncbi:MAG: Homoserine dehydrogenase [Verrucomicrobia subdivision 3 bacterium]|nr:Homoserine dehydrogenase [Limisphaerales bacterium]MCS1415141.1 Homoserine dehydrogenase [Limisphaerales bacterium]
MRRLNVAIIGGGTVGCGVYQALRRNSGLLVARTGTHLQINHVVVRNRRKQRPVRFSERLVSTDWKAAIRDPKTDIVGELIGGTTTAKTIVETALKLGKPVVTANKALLSEHGESLFALAAENGAGLYYEASVAGGIPIIKVLREGLVGNRLNYIYGILNGTCNYILTRMEAEGGDFADVLADAQKKGYAEAKASLDVDGLDAMHKTGLLASLAHGFWVSPDQIHVDGIRQISQMDIEFAGKLGYKIKLLASICRLSTTGSRHSAKEHQIQVSVCPTLIPQSHILASVSGVFNAIYINGDVVGETLYYGHGAGHGATASAVLSDIADAALDHINHQTVRVRPFTRHTSEGQVIPWEDIISEYYMRLTVADKPGTMAKITKVLAESGIGISSIVQPEGHKGASVPLILMIHDAATSAMQKALNQISRLNVVKSPSKMIRVEHFH